MKEVIKDIEKKVETLKDGPLKESIKKDLEKKKKNQILKHA